jgi:hypothetical protein
VFILEKPDGYIWNYPGFPSITVNYAPTTDFFFSGHVGFAVITALDNFEAKWYFMGAISIFSTFLESITMIFLRAHYTIDLLGGIVAGHYTWILAGYICRKVEGKYSIANNDA